MIIECLPFPDRGLGAVVKVKIARGAYASLSDQCVRPLGISSDKIRKSYTGAYSRAGIHGITSIYIYIYIYAL